MADLPLSVRFATDASEATRILRIPEVYLWSSDDSSTPIEGVDLQPAVGGGALLVEVLGGDRVVGFFILFYVSGITREVHVAFEPGCGPVAHRATEMMVSLVFSETPCRKLIAMIPSKNRRACMLASHAGFVREGLLKRAVAIDGQIHDMVVFGRSKE